jgi:phosphohistidine phosphatase SixA
VAFVTPVPHNRPMRALTILIRHADVPAGGGDRALNAAGRARAKELRHVLRDAHVESIFVTEFRRTQQTAEPLAAQLGIVPAVIDQVDVAVLTDKIRNLPAEAVALVIGHTTTLPDISAGLGGPPLPAIGPTEFDRLFVQAHGLLAQLRYGV